MTFGPNLLAVEEIKVILLETYIYINLYHKGFRKYPERSEVLKKDRCMPLGH
jgi:hypothetical protein